jgi:hypothetical protein
MTAVLSLSPVSQAINAALNVASLLALAPGGALDVLPQGTAYPCVLYSVDEAQQLGGFGTKVGSVGRLPEVALRVHVFTQAGSMKSAQAVMAKVLELLADPLTVSGYSNWAIFWDNTVSLPDEVVAGVRVQELVANSRLFVEAA